MDGNLCNFTSFGEAASVSSGNLCLILGPASNCVADSYTLGAGGFMCHESS